MMGETLDLIQADGDNPTLQAWLEQGEILHEQGIINRAEVMLGSPDPAAVKVGHGLTPEGRLAVATATYRLKLIEQPLETREAA